MQKLDNGAVAPPFSVKTITGETLDLTATLARAPVVLVFGHPSINASRLVVGYLRRMVEIAPEAPVWFVLEGAEAEVQKYVGSGDGRYLQQPVVQDHCMLAKQYLVGYLPTIYFIGQDGTIQRGYTGFNRDLLNTIAQEAAIAVGAKPKELISDSDNKGFYELAERGPCL
jgi:hypothetical protein